MRGRRPSPRAAYSARRRGKLAKDATVRHRLAVVAQRMLSRGRADHPGKPGYGPNLGSSKWSSGSLSHHVRDWFENDPRWEAVVTLNGESRGKEKMP
jgi:hypothetical protein